MPVHRGILPVLRSVVGPLDLRRVGTDVLERAMAFASRRVEVAESLHQVRVSLKAFRAVLGLVPSRSRQAARVIDQDARNLGRSLAGLRDREVLQETLGAELARSKEASDRLAAILHRCLPPPPTRRALHQALADARAGLGRLQTGWRALEDPTPSPKAGRRLWVAGVETWRQARRRTRKGGASPFHDWRKMTKRLEYQGWVLGVDRTSSGRQWLAALHRLQEALGREHDLTLLRQHLRHATSGGKPPGWKDLLAQITRRRRGQRRRSRRMSRGWARELEELMRA